MCVLCDLRTRVHDSSTRFESAALSAYLTGRPDIAMIVVEAIYRSFGRDGLYAAAIGWCDVVLRRMPGYEHGAQVYLAWEDVDTGRIIHAEETPPIARWAGQMLAARAADDEAFSRALFNAVPADEETTAQHLSALLEALSYQVRAIHTGDAA